MLSCLTLLLHDVNTHRSSKCARLHVLYNPVLFKLVLLSALKHDIVFCICTYIVQSCSELHTRHVVKIDFQDVTGSVDASVNADQQEVADTDVIMAETTAATSSIVNESSDVTTAPDPPAQPQQPPVSLLYIVSELLVCLKLLHVLFTRVYMRSGNALQLLMFLCFLHF